MKRLPVVLLTGFLGSGKTSLLNRMLRAPGFANTAVIVNEFGEIGLDHVLIESATDNVVLLEAGCLCCTIADSLHETLADLNYRRVRGEVPPFERVVVETTGLADPAPILNTLLGHKLVTDHYELELVVVTADALHIEGELEQHREAVKQIAVADRLVVTKCDAAPRERIESVRTRLRAINPSAELVESRDGSGALAAFRPLENRLAVRTFDAGGNSAHPHSHDVNRHDARVRAHCFVLDAPVSWSGLAAWSRVVVEALGERLLRCKGLVKIADSGEVVFVQGVQRVFHAPQRLAGWPDADHRSRLVCITRDAEEAELRRTLAALKLEAGADPNIRLADL
ncbi:MAG TPA: GTP-binding protein [Burkholderiales bacterium]|jgi:G3E family GTPase|nr:GTP-binding protein [Burkholderiales bacterium]